LSLAESLTVSIGATERGSPSLFRSLAAALYDALLTAAVLFIATAMWLPFTSGQAIEPHNPWFGGYLVVVWFAFHGWCWTHGGQTLGMKAWRLRLYSVRSGPVTWKQSAARFAGAFVSWGVLGLGVVWRLVPPYRQSWHDRLAETYLGWAD
jgi:uncharacterized RDD family membrane protein YckC